MPNALFLWIPRTGGHSVFKTLSPHGLKSIRGSDFRNDDPNRVQHEGAFVFKHAHVDKLLYNNRATQQFINSAFKFTFVRNPWDRIVSAACHEWKRFGEAKGVKSIQEMFKIQIDRIANSKYHDGVRGPWSCRPQAHWLLDKEGKVIPHFIGRHESLYEDLQIICSVLRWPNLEFIPIISSRKQYRPIEPLHDDKSIHVVQEYERKLLDLVPYTYDGS